LGPCAWKIGDMSLGQRSLVKKAFADLLVTALILFGVNRPIFSADKWGVTQGMIVIALLLGVALFARRRFPISGLVISVILSMMLIASGVSGPVTGLAPALSLFTASEHLSTRRFLGVAAFSIASLVGSFILFEPVTLSDPALFAFIALQIIAVATALAAKSRRENLQLLELRALQAEESKESEARSRVGAERLRIARDLHDLIGHQLAATALHAELAERLVENSPDAAVDSLRAIKDSARQSLGELAQMLRVLRDDDEPRTLASMANIYSLIESHRNYGLEVIERLDKDLTGLPAAVELVVFRSLQEALTNAGKYSTPKKVELEIKRQPDSLELHLANKFSSDVSKTLSAGYGLLGLAERVEAIGGLVQISKQDGEFEISISIPLNSEA
jgi:signal transduction histidine kinase